MANIEIIKVQTKSERKAFVDLPYRLYANNPNWTPPLKSEVYALITPGKNPWFEHGEAQYFLAMEGGRVVGRISAHIDHLAQTQPVEQGMGPGFGNWGLFEAETSDVATALLSAAEEHLRGKGMTRSVGPISLCMWDEPGLLVGGHQTPPTVMMGYNDAAYEPWIDAAGYAAIQDLYTYSLPIDAGLPDIVNRIVASGERSGKITIRKVNKNRFDQEVQIILNILNDAWSDNWGFVPFTDSEIAYGGKKLKPIVYEDLIRVAEVDGKPVAFMMTLPNLNEKIASFGGTLWPFNWAKLLWWLRAPKAKIMRVPLMGVVKELQSSRLASQLAFMLIEYIRRDSVKKYGSTHGDFGWVLASNGPMRSVGEAVGGSVDKTYRIYEKAL